MVEIASRPTVRIVYVPRPRVWIYEREGIRKNKLSQGFIPADKILLTLTYDHPRRGRGKKKNETQIERAQPNIQTQGNRRLVLGKIEFEFSTRHFTGLFRDNRFLFDEN